MLILSLTTLFLLGCKPPSLAVGGGDSGGAAGGGGNVVLPTLTLTSPAEGALIDAAHQGSFAVSGTCSVPSRPVVISGAATASTLCLADQSFSVALDFSGAADGSVSIVANLSDAAGNAASPVSRTFTKQSSSGQSLGAPQSLALENGLSTLYVSWSAPSSGTATSYTATLSPGGATSTVSETHTTFTGLTPGTSYTVSVSAKDAANNVSASSSGTLAASDLVGKAGYSQISLSWANATGATGYSVYRGTSQGSLALLVDMGNNTRFEDTSVLNGSTYFYKIYPYDGSGPLSGTTQEVSATPSALKPKFPRKLSAKTAEDGQVTLEWEAANGGGAATQYKIYRSTSGDAPALGFPFATTSSLTYTDASVTNGTKYYYRVTAANASGDSAASTWMWAIPLAANAARDSANLFVSPTGSGDGSLANPYGSLSTALSNVSTGGAITFLDGSYSLASETVIGAAVTLRSRTGSYLNSDATLSASGNAYSLLRISDPGLSDVSILGLKFTSVGQVGSLTYAVFHNYQSRGSDRIAFMNNSVDDVFGMAVHAEDQLGSGSGLGKAWTVTGNYVHQVKATSASCLRLYYVTQSVVMDNDVSNCAYGGILLNGVENSVIAWNTIDSTYTAGIGQGSTFGQNYAINSNTISNANTSGIASYGGIRIYDLTAGSSFIMFNAISSSVDGFVVNSTSAALTGTLSVNYNAFSSDTGYGIHNNATSPSAVVNGINNYWGCAAGPGGGTGCDAVSAGVTSSPYLNAAP